MSRSDTQARRRILINGVLWDLFEAASELDRRRGASLIFSWADIMRRDYRLAGAQRDDATLIALCEGDIS